MDYMHRKTDKELAQLEKRLKVEYTKALKDLKKTAETYFKSFAVLDEKKRKALDDNKITYDDYIDWRMGRMLTGEKYNDTIELMTNRLVEADKDASVLINGIVPDVYTKNYNYGETMIPKGLKTGIQFTFANPKTVNNILKVNNRVLPQSQIKIDKDKRWNNRKIRSALSQGVILGESIPKIAKRLQTVTDMDKNSAIRNARTAVTGAENAGRLDSFFEMRRLGLDPKKQWIATEDNRTRLSHRLVDGQIREIEEPFSNGLLYPADPHVNKPAEIYNCRCTLIAVFDDEEDESMVANVSPSLKIRETDLYELENRMSESDRQKFNELFKKANIVENPYDKIPDEELTEEELKSKGKCYYDPRTNTVVISTSFTEPWALYHEVGHWLDYNQKYILTMDFGRYEYLLDENGVFTGEKQWIPKSEVVKEDATFSEYINHKWIMTTPEQEVSFAQLDTDNLKQKLKLSDTYTNGYGRGVDSVNDYQAIKKYLAEKKIDENDPDFVYINDFISAMTYDSNMTKITGGGHSYEYWFDNKLKITEITTEYNILRSLGREDLINIERELAPNLMKLIESEWTKIW